MQKVENREKSKMLIKVSAVLLIVFAFVKSTKAHSAATAGTALAYVTAWSNLLNPILESFMFLAAIAASVATAIYYWRKLRKEDQGPDG